MLHLINVDGFWTLQGTSWISYGWNAKVLNLDFFTSHGDASFCINYIDGQWLLPCENIEGYHFIPDGLIGILTHLSLRCLSLDL